MHTEPVTRDNVFNMRLNDEELARMQALADHHGVDRAGLVRILLKKEERKLRASGDLEPPADRGKPKKR
jgi:hypothetical protein